MNCGKAGITIRRPTPAGISTRSKPLGLWRAAENTASVSSPTLSVSERVKAVAAALVIGVALIYTTGFAASTNVHNAAHDTRHGLAFPCH